MELKIVDYPGLSLQYNKDSVLLNENILGIMKVIFQKKMHLVADTWRSIRI